ncbi:hypothetical protein [Microbacterium marinum]
MKTPEQIAKEIAPSVAKSTPRSWAAIRTYIAAAIEADRAQRNAPGMALLAEWDAAATPDERSLHNGGGFARDHWDLIRATLRVAIS